MFVYEKRLQYPVNIKTTNPKLAKIIITQYGGAYGQRLLFFAKRKERNNILNQLKSADWLLSKKTVPVPLQGGEKLFFPLLMKAEQAFLLLSAYPNEKAYL